MKWRACAVASALALSVLVASSLANAGGAGGSGEPEPPPPPPGAPVISLVAAPIFGADAATGTGWSEVVARIENLSATVQKGVVELTSSATYGNADQFTAKAPFSVPVGRSVVVRLPTHGSTSYSPSLAITATGGIGDKSQILATATINVNSATTPLLVDVDQPSRLSVVMRSWPITTPWNVAPSGYYGGSPTTGTQTLTVGAPAFDRTTGDPILPEHAAGYSAVTVVIIHSDTLAKLDKAALDALVNWTLAGGSLAVVANRPEDLHGPVLTALAGGAVTATDVPGHMLTFPGAVRPPSGSSFDPFGSDPTPAPTAAPLNFDVGGPVKLTPITRQAVVPRTGPVGGVKEKLSGYAGGNLQESDFGATASYGLGEVHLLAFDPTVAPMLDDAWVHGRMTDLVARAWDRHALNAFPQGTGERNTMRNEDVRRELDPNENFRPGLAISAILLVIYSIVAGPLTFARAAKKSKPLSPLKWAPIWSLVAFGSIVLVGLASKGWRGRARHFSIVEAGAGVTRGSVRRFRGFFASETRSLSVNATDRSCVLDVSNADSTHENAVLRLDRNGATLENLTSLPWQTVVVREDGFMDLKGAISVVPTPDGSADVVNRTGRTLKDVMVWMPSDGISYFAEVKDGAKLHASAGKMLLRATARRSTSAGTRTVHPLEARDLALAVSGKYGDSLATTWTAIETAAGDATDYWPDDVPVVIGELVGGEHTTADSGLSVENDRVLFRVVGRGGAP